MRVLLSMIVGLVLLPLAGLAADDPEQTPPPRSPVIKPGHLLDIRVVAGGELEVEELNRRISSTGDVSLLLLGKVRVEGLTLAELTRLLESRYVRYIREPVVDVTFVVDNSPGAVSPWGYVTVLGNVASPGRINIPPTEDLTLSMAVQLAGGLEDTARESKIQVTRKLPNGKVKTWRVDLKSLASEGKIEEDILLQGSDIIFVPEKLF